ncbi:hypothetical protein ACAG25_07395 [Mycobacterium sp. pV006]|uniref:hypothetical protein n=1 Tax=Mycobacterium sp. pV006 TaxID=3238983 RepID=UPI00351AE539
MDEKLLNVLRTVTVPAALTNCQTLVDYMKAHVEADTHSQTPEAGVQRLNEMLGLMLASQLEIINSLGDIDQQLRTIGQRLKGQ